jgi:tetratricopeptide (TPR) repeat protein
MRSNVNASDTVILKKKGKMLLTTGQSQEAMKIYDQVLFWNNNDPAALMRKGDSQVRAGNLDKALSYYDAALAIDPNDPKLSVIVSARVLTATQNPVARYQSLLDNF